MVLNCPYNDFENAAALKTSEIFLKNNKCTESYLTNTKTLVKLSKNVRCFHNHIIHS